MEPIPPDAAEPPSNVLLLHDRGCAPEGCRGLCRADGPAAELRVSFASEGRRPRDGNGTASRVGILSVGDVIRAGSAEGEPDYAAPVAVDAVADPTDIAAIGVSVSRFCEHWLGDEQLVVCFRSLDALLRHSSPKTVFEFTYYLNRRLASVGALAHFHLDPTLHDDRIVATFGEIFDAVVADESAEDSLPEATDEDVARILANLDDSTDDDLDRDRGGFDEATDEEIERVLGV